MGADMDWLTLAGVAAANYVLIAAKAAQQLNVVHGLYLSVIPTTAALAVCEVTVISTIAGVATGQEWPMLAAVAAAMTVGGATGAMTAMALHKRWRQ